MGNKMKSTLVGRGTIKIQRESRKTNNYTDVLQILGLGMNLISYLHYKIRGTMSTSWDKRCTLNTKVGRR